MKKFIKLTLAGALVASPLCLAAQGFTFAQKQELNQIISQYISNNPTVVMSSLVKYREQEMQKQHIQAQSAITSNAKQLIHSSYSPVLGNPRGDVTIVEFLDYRCGHCKEMESITKKLIASDANVRLIVKQLPIFSGESITAAKLALASKLQGKFASLHHMLLTANTPLTTDTISRLVKQSGVNVALANKTIAEAWVQTEIDNNMLLAKKIGLMGTPAFVVLNSTNFGHNELVPGAISLERLQQIVANIRSFK